MSTIPTTATASPMKLSRMVAVVYDACLRMGPPTAARFEVRDLRKTIMAPKRLGRKAKSQLYILAHRHRLIDFHGDGRATVHRVPYIVANKTKAGHRVPPAWVSCDFLFFD